MALTTRLPSTKVEPFYGFVETTGDALRLIQAARQGFIPRITRRLNDLERRAMIRSGAIFIFSDEESGIKRWTEGLSWSASRIVGNFLVYREVSDRSNPSVQHETRKVSKRRGSSNELSPTELAEQKLAKSLVGCLSDGNGRFKPKGLVKKTITVCVEGSDHHLIAYYSQEDVRLGKLLPLTSRADIMALDIPPELLESTKFRILPIMSEGPDGRPRYMCDAEEGELPRPVSIPFPSHPRASIPQANITHYLPLLQNSITYQEYTPRAPAVRSSIANLNQTPSIPLAKLNSFHGSIEWATVPMAQRRSYLHDADQPHQVARADQCSEALGMPSSFHCLERDIAAQTPSASSAMISAWSTNCGTGPEAALSFETSSLSSASSTNSHSIQCDYLLPTWAESHIPQRSPTFCSSLPSSPAQPRQTYRFTSLPSAFDIGSNGLPLAAPAPLNSKPANVQVAYSQADTTSLIDDLLRIHPRW